MVVKQYLNEVWKDIPDFEGQYQASNYGRIKSLYYGKEKILKPANNGNGYLVVGLSKNGKKRWCLVHRLVWMTFNGEIPDGMQINHKSEVKTENNLENLELVTPKENMNWGTCKERSHNKQINDKRSKQVLQFDLNGNLIKEWESINEIKRQLGYTTSNICACCKGKLITAYKYVWKYV